MNAYETWSTVLNILTVIIGGVGLIGLWLYVRKTSAIAKATQEHNEILYRPAVTVQMYAMPEESRKRDCPAWAHIKTLIQNHTTIHASLRITVRFHLRESPDSNQTEIFEAREHYGGKEWGFAAMCKFCGHFTIPELKARKIAEPNILIMEVDVASSPLNLNKYNSNPHEIYLWSHADEKWVPYAVPLD